VQHGVVYLVPEIKHLFIICSLVDVTDYGFHVFFLDEDGGHRALSDKVICQLALKQCNENKP
jgi:hypothetical protein